MADFSFTVDPASLRKLFDQLDHATATATLRAPMERSLAAMQHDLQTYPSQSKRPQPFKSDRQRRFVMMMVRQGKVPYRRTGNLGRTWTTHVATSTNGIEGTVGNKTDYAPLVQGARTQAAYHRGNWPTDESVFNAHRSAIERDFLNAIDNALR